MKLLTTIALCAISVSAYAYIPLEKPEYNGHGHVGQVQRAQPTTMGQSIYNELRELAGVPDSVQLIVTRNSGSETDGVSVYLDAGDIAMCNHNRSCVAFILGHELGHIVHQDMQHPEHEPHQEKDADLYAVQLLKKSGDFDSCAGTIFFQNIINQYGDGGDEDGIHPKHSTRIQYIDKACGAGYSWYK